MGLPLLKQLLVFSAVFLTSISHSFFHFSFIYYLELKFSNVHFVLENLIYLCMVTNAVGAIFSSIVMMYFGRRFTYRIQLVPGIVAGLLLIFGTNISTWRVAMMLASFSAGGTESLGYIVIGEYCSPEYRSTFLHLNNLAHVTGVLAAFLLTLEFEYLILTISSTVGFSMALLIVLLLWPESPEWLASRKKQEESEKSFYWLRGNTERSKREISVISKVHSDMREKISFQRFISRRELLKPLGLMVVAMLLEICGRHYIANPAMNITKPLSKLLKPDYNIDVVINAAPVLSVGLSVMFVQFTKRHTLLLASSYISCIFLSIFFALLYFLDQSERTCSMVTTISFYLYWAFANLSSVNLSLVLIGELFPFDCKSIAMATAGVTLNLLKFGESKLTPFLLENTGLFWILTINSIVMLLCVMVLNSYLPETEGRTLQNIVKYFQRSKPKVNSDTDMELEAARYG